MINGMISFVIPSVRVNGLERTLDATIRESEGWPIEIIVVTESRDVGERMAKVSNEYGRNHVKRWKLLFEPNRVRGCIEAWNDGLRVSEGEYICFWSDDVVPHERFLHNTIPLFKDFADGEGYVAFNDLQNSPDVLCTFYIAHRRYIIKYQGGVLGYPCYNGLFNDTESMHRAKRANRFRYAKDAVAEHMHPSSGKRVKDEWDDRMSDTWEHDLRVFREREGAGFPDTWEPVITE